VLPARREGSDAARAASVEPRYMAGGDPSGSPDDATSGRGTATTCTARGDAEGSCARGRDREKLPSGSGGRSGGAHDEGSVRGGRESVSFGVSVTVRSVRPGHASCGPQGRATQSDELKSVASGIAEWRLPDAPTCTLRGAARDVGHNGWRQRSAGAIVPGHWDRLEMRMQPGDQT
jgi:hypothetical protein